MNTHQKFERYIFDIIISEKLKTKKRSSSKETIKINPTSGLRTTNEINMNKTKDQVKKEQRDYKRRTTKYRAQNVHITKRTPKMIARALIQEQMEEYFGIQTSLDNKESSLPLSSLSSVERKSKYSKTFH